DDVHVAETLELIFMARGYKVRKANSAEEAIETISNWEPELAIVDVMLPRMNGIEFGQVLHANYPNCRLILVSGHPGTEDLLKVAREDGQPLWEILAKPLHPRRILEIVAGLLPGITGEA
ncbi:MAG: response regulator, partial [Acidobacteriota bacterium]